MYLSLVFRGGYVPRPFAKTKSPQIIFRLPHNVFFLMFRRSILIGADSFFLQDPGTSSGIAQLEDHFTLSENCDSSVHLRIFLFFGLSCEFAKPQIRSPRKARGGSTAFLYRSVCSKDGTGNFLQNARKQFPK